MKKFFLTCLLALLSAVTWAFTYDGLTYTIVSADDLTCEVAYGSGNEYGDVVIPEQVYNEDDGNTYTVIGLGVEAFEFSSVTSVVIPSSVTYMKDLVFYGCYELISLTIGENVETIEGGAFIDCESMEEMYCLNPTPPTLGEYDAYNGERTFDYFPLTTCILRVPHGSSEAYATADMWKEFQNIVELDESFSVETTAVTDVTNTTATLHGAVTAGSEEILEQGFEYWSDSNNVQSIVATEVSDDGEISSTIQKLSPATEYTFRAYARTESGPLYGERMTFTTTNYDFSEDGIYYYKLTDSTVAVQYLYRSSTDNGTTYEGELVIPTTITHEGTTYRVTTINEYAFYECRNLTKVTIPESVTDIGPYSFYNCTSLEEATFPSTVSTIWEYTFFGCTNLKEANISSSITTIRQYAFSESGLTEVIVPSTVQNLQSGIFANCVELKKATLEEGVPSLGIAYMFYACTSLEEVSIPESVSEIPEYTFTNCSSLRSITIPSKVTSLPSYTFDGCSSLEDVSLPNTLSEMGGYIFRNCTSLKSFVYPNSMTNTGVDAFYGCISLKDVTFSENTIEISNATFSRCTGLEKLTIPEGVTIVGSMVFDACESLNEVRLPATLESIGYQAFRNCSSMEKLYCLNPTPPTLQDLYPYGWFDGINENCVLYVPVGAKEIYSTTDVWKDFFKTMVELASVETLAAEDITARSAILNGAVTAGDATITRKGFECWTDEMPEAMTTITISGDDMVYTIDTLTPETTYTYHAFAETSDGTFYGEDVVFTTLEDIPDGINTVGMGSTNSGNIEGIYSTSGQKLNTTVKGVNIIRYADGTTKKVIIK